MSTPTPETLPGEHDERLAALAEPPVTGTPGAYWPQPVLDEDTEAARQIAVDAALAQLEGLLTRATRTDKRRSTATDLRARALLLGAVERALADPQAGYLRRLRRERSAILRERVARGATVSDLALELGVSPQRVRTLLANNRSYVSEERRAALDDLAAQAEQQRAARAAARQADRDAALAARVAEGRALAARLAAGESRDRLIADTGYTRQRLASLLTVARKADVDAADN